ncbi:twin-arginine translocase TatA/TatE family subunit [Patescibacteria group bacterium]|jgi:sec-independent protein translocase protein TatA|nr:twin-arginine translocase TatA/TatE family subunit [Patescibacteria group bacterium]
MFGLGTKEIIIIAVILVLLFGAKKIPELANGIGEAVKNLRRGFGGNVDDKGQENKKK